MRLARRRSPVFCWHLSLFSAVETPLLARELLPAAGGTFPRRDLPHRVGTAAGPYLAADGQALGTCQVLISSVEL